MAAHTVTLNPRQESGLADAVAIENARRAAMVPPPTPLTVTADQYLDFVAGQAALAWERARRARVTGLPDVIADQVTPGEEAILKAIRDKYATVAP